MSSAWSKRLSYPGGDNGHGHDRNFRRLKRPKKYNTKLAQNIPTIKLRADRSSPCSHFLGIFLATDQPTDQPTGQSTRSLPFPFLFSPRANNKITR